MRKDLRKRRNRFEKNSVVTSKRKPLSARTDSGFLMTLVSPDLELSDCLSVRNTNQAFEGAVDRGCVVVVIDILADEADASVTHQDLNAAGVCTAEALATVDGLGIDSREAASESVREVVIRQNSS